MSDSESGRISKLLGHLNNHCARALDEAAGLAISRTHHEVGMEHWLLKLMEEGDGDVPQLFKHFRIDPDRVWSALLNNIENHYRGGNQDTPSFSSSLVELMDEARRFCLVDLDSTQIRSGALLFAMLSLRGYRLPEGLQLLDNIPLAVLRRDFLSLTQRSDESRSALAPATPAAVEPALTKDASEAAEPSGAAHVPMKTARVAAALNKFTVDLTQKARLGEVDPVFGREHEIRQLIDILSRRRKNNPILVGEPGVGKTAIVEGLALQIVQGAVPASLKDVELRVLDLGLLQAGASMKGEFESRLRGVIDEVKASSVPIMLFIDEAHTLIGAGNAQGAGDAANLLKPALARGELRTIAATTWSEYKQYFERDAALERRFQMVKVDEPDEAAATGMLRGLKPRYEAFHGLTITDEAVQMAVRLSMRFIPARQLPDKGVDLLDTASARVKMSAAVPPAALSALAEQAAGLLREREALARDLSLAQASKPEALEQRLLDISAKLAAIEAEQARLQSQLDQEQSLVQQLQDLGEALRTAAEGPARANTAELRTRIHALRQDLAAVQGEAPLLHLEVGAHVVAQVVADWTGIPAGKMLKDEMAGLLSIEQRLGERVVGQDEGLALIAEGLRNARMGLRKKEAPLGVFLLVGPSGVGKTETALCVADVLFGGERSVITINMSEYQEAHTVSQLKGSPPGYVGYGEGGVLTEAVRQRPYSVVLLDEVEKAHRDVMNLFYQVFDRGFMRDGEGREIDFKNTVILMTSNLGSLTLMAHWQRYEGVNAEVALEQIRPELLAHFQPALLARMQVVPYLPLAQEQLTRIVGLKLGRLAQRLQESWQITLHHTEALACLLADGCNTPDSGARSIDRLIEQSLLPAISRELLQRLSSDTMPVAIFLSADDEEGINIDYLDTPDKVAALQQGLQAQAAVQMQRRAERLQAQLAQAQPEVQGDTAGLLT
ncbi:type VI secretion system ATPase TssH [Roseateles koreensis]|uniref:Type VI secretion system ATPase TssH n=1 Tax=Roseateles koreensis TaxID=2987526 RepID=A0ABT5KR32_9BURK|nr:type VI secretion system ATPase TssH [Roseateles koreensis]MDC8785307.1 type VI secretion system ATPase TssH [Roseateles koreensis]